MFENQKPYAEIRDVAPLPAPAGSGRPPVTDDLHPITDAICFLQMRVIEDMSEREWLSWSAGEMRDLKRMCERYARHVPIIADLYDAMRELRDRKRPFSYTTEHIIEWETAWNAYRQNTN